MNKPVYPDEGGFLLKFDGKKAAYCYAVKLDYDEWKYELNNTKTKRLPADLKTVTIEVEHPG